MLSTLLCILKTRKINKSKQIKQTKQTNQTTMSSFTNSEQKQFVVPSVNNRWTKVARPQQQCRQQRRPQQQGRQQRRPQYRGRQNRRPYNNRRRNYRKKQLPPQKGTKIATGSLLDMAMIKHKDGSKSVKVQSSRNGKRVIEHASLSQVLKKKTEFKDKSNSFSALAQEETVGTIVPRPTVINTVARPQGKWGTPLSSKVKQDEEFKYEAGSQLEKQHLKRLQELEQEKLAEKLIAKSELENMKLKIGQMKWIVRRKIIFNITKIREGYDLSFQPDVDDADYEEYCDLQYELARQEEEYNHQAEIQQLDGWYD